MSENKKTFGAAIDDIVNALSAVDEKDRLTALSAACSHLSLKFEGNENLKSKSITQPLLSETDFDDFTKSKEKIFTDIRSLKEEKNPASAREMACVVAFYLQNLAPTEEQKEIIGTAEISKYFKQANYPLPKAIEKLLQDAKAAGYFDSAAERGGYKLNAVGYNLVAHTMPRENQKTIKRTTKKAVNKKPSKLTSKSSNKNAPKKTSKKSKK